MSIETTTGVEVTPNTFETSVQTTEDLVSSNAHDLCVQAPDPLVDVVKKEYAIVGDGLFASVTASETPYWLSVLIDNTVNNSLISSLSDYNDLRQDVANAVSTIEVASNNYVEAINFDTDVNAAITTRLATQNATYEGQFATKAELTTAVADSDAAQAVDIAALSVSFNDTIDARIIAVETAYADADSALTSSINSLTTSYTDLNSSISGNASALSGLQSFVGVDALNSPNGTGLNSIITSHSTAFTNLENGITGTAGETAYSLSNLEQRSEAYADDVGVGVESKFEYNTILNINGQYHTAGFGLTATGVTQPPGADGSLGNPFDSRFWVNADEFIISDEIGASNPVFSVDTGTRDVIFNGRVTFNSGGGSQVGTIDEAITASVTQVAVGDKNINITDNLIPTTSLVTDVNNAGYSFVGDPVKSSAVGIATFAEPQIVLDVDDEVYSPYVDELGAAYYYRFGIKGITDLSPIKITTLDVSDVATYGTLVHQMEAGETLSASQWYTVEGIVNPTGGSDDFSGIIRLPDGTKVGTIRNYVMPADATKLMLGWQYSVDISRMKLAKITADTITGSFASTDYVNTTISNYAPDYSALVGKDLLAQQLGYVDYPALETAYSGGATVINGGSLNTGLIAAEGITADMVVSSGLITNTAQINDALITTAKINNAAITTAKIDDAAITTAKIGTASVDTLNLAGQAVTIPSSAFTGASMNVSFNYVTIQQVTFTSSGNPVVINFSGTFAMSADTTNPRTADARLLRNGSVVASFPAMMSLTTAGDTTGVTLKSTFSLGFKDTPPAGSVTYAIQVKNGAIANRSLTCLEVKR